MRRLVRILVAAKFLRRLYERGVLGTDDELAGRALRLADRVVRR